MLKRLLLISLLVGVLGPATHPVTAKRSPYSDGETVQITGTVTNSKGDPLPDLKVVLTAARRGISLKSFSLKDKNPRSRTASTDARGQFSIDWPWSDYFTSFELTVGVDEPRSGKSKFRRLETVDLSRRIRRGSPVVTVVTIEDSEFLSARQSSASNTQSPDEQRVYERHGNPDSIRRVTYFDSEEITWWYFAAGKAYRFCSGVLEDVHEFEPILPF